MLEHIIGRIEEVRWLDGGVSPQADAVVATPTGLGFLVRVPVETARRLKVGEEARLLLHLRVGEERTELFGFSTPAERAFFRLLLQVNRVGPAVALSVLSLGTAALQRALATGDVSALARQKGIGRKTAERLVLELKEKVAAIDLGAAADLAGAGPARTSAIEDAVLALKNLGFGPSVAREAVERASAALGEGADVAALVREGLRRAATPCS